MKYSGSSVAKYATIRRVSIQNLPVVGKVVAVEGVKVEGLEPAGQAGVVLQASGRGS